MIFLLVSLWCACWALIPERNPIPQNRYYIGAFVALCTGIASLQYLRGGCADKLRWLCAQATLLLLYVFKVKKRHYPRMAIKAMGQAADYPETRREIEEYDRRTQQVIADSKEFMADPKLRKEYDDYRRFKIDL